MKEKIDRPVIPGSEVIVVHDLEDLPLLNKAAKQTGFRVSVKAKEGESCNFPTLDTRRLFIEDSHIITVEPGKVAVSIRRPNEHKGDYGPFWKAYNSLKKQPKIKT